MAARGDVGNFLSSRTCSFFPAPNHSEGRGIYSILSISDLLVVPFLKLGFIERKLHTYLTINRGILALCLRFGPTGSQVERIILRFSTTLPVLKFEHVVILC